MNYDRAVEVSLTEDPIETLVKIANKMGNEGLRVYKIIGPLKESEDNLDTIYVLKVSPFQELQEIKVKISNEIDPTKPPSEQGGKINPSFSGGALR